MLMGLDVGTTGVKAAVFRPDGYMAGYAFEEYGVRYPSAGRAEQDGETVWTAALGVIARAAAQAGGDIEAISLSAQGDAIAPVGADGVALGPFQLGMDYRADAETAAFETESGARGIFRKTGMRPHPMNSICKIRWLTAHEPRLAASAYKFMTYADYILWKLGADEPVIDLTMAGRTMALDIRTERWDGALTAAAGIEPERLSRPVAPGLAVGTLRAAVCAATGIRPGARLVTGGHDQACAALGAGIVEPGMALDSHGTAEVISTAFHRPRLDDAMFNSFFPCYRHVLPGMYVTFSLNHAAGIILKWFVEGFCGDDAVPAEAAGARLYEYVLRRAGPGPSPLLVLPFLNGSGTPDCDLMAKGVIAGLTLSSTRHDVALAILEALCFDMRTNLAALAGADIRVAELRCAGGGARSPIGLQLKADITGLPVHTLRVREAACLGAAILAGAGTGRFDSAAGAAAELVKPRDSYFPCEKRHEAYSERFALYNGLNAACRAIMRRM